MVAAYVLLLAHGLGVLFFRGNGYRTNGNADKAIADCTEAIRLDPSDAKAYCGRGKGLLEQTQLRQGDSRLHRGHPS